MLKIKRNELEQNFAKIRGISFCQIDRNQILTQLIFWISFRYQNWKGALPSFNIIAVKKINLNKFISQTKKTKILNNIKALPNL